MTEDRAAAPAGGVRAARIAVSLAFFSFGAGFAMWAVHIPLIATRLALDPATLGLALLNVGLGGIVSQPTTGWLLQSVRSAPVTRALLLVFLAILPAPILAPTLPMLFAATFLLGAAAGAFNVAVNTQASEIETARHRPTMSSFHGFFSLGALAGSAIGGVVIAAGLGQGGVGALAVLAILFVASFLYTPHFLPTVPRRHRTSGAKRDRSLPSLAVLGLSLLTFFSNTVEGAVNDWSALYLATTRGLSPATAVSGFAIFSAVMAGCRLFGGPIVSRFGERNVVLFGGMLMAVGMGVVVFSPWATLSPLGFGLVALGAANTIPIMVSAAARAPDTAPSVGVAAASTGALLGFLIGPPVIGFIAHAAGLAFALALLSVAGVLIAVGASIYRWPAARPAPAG